jgi:hypothetical protein
MTDQMPPNRQRSGRENLALAFLDLVFAEVDLSGGGGHAHGVDRKCLRDRDEADRGGIATGATSGARDSLADAVQPAGDVEGHRTIVGQMAR